jgi:hypothetical protein
VSFSVSVTFSVVSLTVPEAFVPSEAAVLALAEADGAGVELAVSSGVRIFLMASPTPSGSSGFVVLADAEGAGVDAALSAALPDVLAEEDAEGAGVALSPEPESGEEVLPGAADSDDAEGAGVAWSEDALALALALALAEADGVAVADASLPFTASTHAWYSSAVRVLDVAWSSAWASVGTKPIPMRTAVGIAAMAIALPAGIWILVSSGFLGAAWRGPVLTRESSTSVPWVTSSAGTVPPVRPVARARS